MKICTPLDRVWSFTLVGVMFENLEFYTSDQTITGFLVQIDTSLDRVENSPGYRFNLLS